MITIKDIAKEANVSEGTVDRVLHNRGGVSKKTETRIKELLKKHNFKVNPAASALAMKNKFKLTTLMPNYNSDDLFWKPPYLGVLKASQEVSNYGVEVTVFTFDQLDSVSYLKQFKILMDTSPSAVVIVPTFSKETALIVNELEYKNIPYMFFNIDLDGFNNISFIGQDSFMGGYLAGKLMSLSLAKSSALLIIQTRINIGNYHAISKRMEGFRDYFIKNKIQTEILNLTIDNLNDTKKASHKLNTFLKKHKTIKGVFVPSSRISIISQCIENGNLDKLQMIGFDNTPQNIQCLEKDMVSFLISQKPFNQGYESILLMTEYLTKNRKPINKIYSPIDILTKENVQFNERNELLFEN